MYIYIYIIYIYIYDYICNIPQSIPPSARINPLENNPKSLPTFPRGWKLTILCCQVESCCTCLLCCFDIHSSLQQKIHHVDLPRSRGRSNASGASCCCCQLQNYLNKTDVCIKRSCYMYIYIYNIYIYFYHVISFHTIFDTTGTIKSFFGGFLPPFENARPQILHSWNLTVLRSCVQDVGAHLISAVQLGTSFQQETEHGHVTVARSHMKSRETCLLGRWLHACSPGLVWDDTSAGLDESDNSSPPEDLCT